MENWPKSEIKSSWSRFKHCSESRLAHRKSYLIIICLNSHEMLTKNEIMAREIGSNISQTRSSSLLEVIYNHFWPQFTWKIDQIRSSYYVLQFGFIYPYLAQHTMFVHI